MPDDFPSWEDVQERLNTPGLTEKQSNHYLQGAAVQLEEALQLGYLIESERDPNILLARQQLAQLGKLNCTVSRPALDALCSLLLRDAQSEQDNEKLPALLGTIVDILETEKDDMGPDRAAKLMEVCAFILERRLLLYSRGCMLAQDFGKKYKLWDLIEYFQRLNKPVNPDIAAWGAFALEQLKSVDAPISLVAIFSKVEEVLSKLILSGAAAHDAITNEAGSRAKAPGVLTETIAKVRYLFKKRKWGKVLKEIRSKRKDAEKDTAALEKMQQRMKETIEKTKSDSFVYFCVQIFSEIIQEETAHPDVQARAFANRDLPSLSYFAEHVIEHMRDPKSKMGEAKTSLRKFFLKLPEDLWRNPRFILTLTSTLECLKKHPNPDIQRQSAAYSEELKRLMMHDNYRAVRTIHDHRSQNQDIQAEQHYKLLSQTLEALNSHAKHVEQEEMRRLQDKARAEKEEKRRRVNEARAEEKEKLELELLRIRLQKARLSAAGFALEVGANNTPASGDDELSKEED